MITRPLEIDEYKKIIELFYSGFRNNKTNRMFHPNIEIALALQLQATLGLRISDVLKLKVNDFKSGKIQLPEGKTKKLQYRTINKDVYCYIKDYAIEKQLKGGDKLLNLKERNVQQRLKTVVEYLGLSNISTHSFRKMFATIAYEKSSNDIELVRKLLNHSSITAMQRYINVSQEKIDKASSEINFLISTN